MEMDHLEGLTEPQRQAVEHREGPANKGQRSRVGYKEKMRAMGTRVPFDPDGLPPVSILDQLFTFSIKNGSFDGGIFHKARPVSWFASVRGAKSWNTKYAGSVALDNKSSDGYLSGTLFYRTFKAHRVIFKMVHGFCPEYIDHINGNKADNRQENLRAVTKVENGRNSKKKKNNTSGVNGVSWKKSLGKWAAKIVLDKRQVHLGYFDTIEQATLARKNAEEGHGFSARHGQ